MAVMMPSRIMVPNMAFNNFTIQSACLRENTSSIKICPMTGIANPGMIMQRPSTIRKISAHLSSLSLAATVLTML